MTATPCTRTITMEPGELERVPLGHLEASGDAKSVCEALLGVEMTFTEKAHREKSR